MHINKYFSTYTRFYYYRYFFDSNVDRARIMVNVALIMALGATYYVHAVTAISRTNHHEMVKNKKKEQGKQPGGKQTTPSSVCEC